MKCPDCSSSHIVKAGMITNKTGKKQRYKCWDCGRTFYPKKKSPTGQAVEDATRGAIGVSLLGG